MDMLEEFRRRLIAADPVNPNISEKYVSENYRPITNFDAGFGGGQTDFYLLAGITKGYERDLSQEHPDYVRGWLEGVKYKSNVFAAYITSCAMTKVAASGKERKQLE